MALRSMAFKQVYKVLGMECLNINSASINNNNQQQNQQQTGGDNRMARKRPLTSSSLNDSQSKTFEFN